MKITNIVQGKKDRERVNIFVDGEYRFSVDKNTFVKLGVYKNYEITEAEISEFILLDAKYFLSRRLLSWCFKRPRSEREIRGKILELVSKREQLKNLDSSQIEELTVQVLAKLSQQGISDAVFAEWFVKERVRQGKYGRRKIISELFGKGISKELMDKILEEHFPSQEKVKQQVLLKKYGVESLEEIKDYKEKQQAYRFLASRGF